MTNFNLNIPKGKANITHMHKAEMVAVAAAAAVVLVGAPKALPVIESVVTKALPAGNGVAEKLPLGDLVKNLGRREVINLEV